MKPPKMASWNLGLRFVLEIAALVGLGAAAWASTTGAMQWIAVVAVPIATAAIWGTFNVVGDPSRSGEAPVEVAGSIRLAIELATLSGGVLAVAIAGSPVLAIVFAVLVVLHYAASWNRVQWLLGA